MKRVFGFISCALIGLAFLFCGLMTPAHLRVVDAGVIAKAGANRETVADRGTSLARNYDFGAAQLLLDASYRDELPGSEKLAFAITSAGAQHPDYKAWGGGAKADLAAILT